MNLNFPQPSEADDLKKQATNTQTMGSTQASSLSKVQEEIRLIGMIHLLINILSAATFGALFALLYLLLKKDQLDRVVKGELIEILNFNISFFVYGFITVALFFLLIGFLILPFLVIFYIITLILGAIKHVNGETYRYPGIFRVIKNI